MFGLLKVRGSLCMWTVLDCVSGKEIAETTSREIAWFQGEVITKGDWGVKVSLCLTLFSVPCLIWG